MNMKLFLSTDWSYLTNNVQMYNTFEATHLAFLLSGKQGLPYGDSHKTGPVVPFRG